MLKAIVVIILTPLLLCIGVYSCTAVHLAMLTH
jgi:hypothetical protein